MTDVSGYPRLHFLMLAGMNLVWSFLLIRRAYRGMYRYGVWFAIGKLSPRWSATAPDFNVALLGNTILDLFIFLILVPIIREFVGGVAILRVRHGFPQEEIIFRKPSESTIANIVSEAPEKRDAFVKDLLRRAVDPEEIKQATFGLPWEEWVYDYRAMAAACELVKNGVISARTWELCVWMKLKDGWTAVEQGKEDDMQNQVGMMEKMRVWSLAGCDLVFAHGFDYATGSLARDGQATRFQPDDGGYSGENGVKGWCATASDRGR